ncbi:adenylosuccinate lyase [Marinicella gelatinilytica]|uniref:adenylosuccinate lyase n=1 Tax=Marinicella gelatinilytica TaxID=2996017 RepID=UPI002260DD80|nr:adenylosuccinate lyase [Marinicella gelatinilytica]MCX7546002.1 adenylosuccinate lyase [Marinicella gelatinilytica]
MSLSALTAVSAVDGRYQSKTRDLSPFFSEYGLIKNRLLVEISWLIQLSESTDIKELPAFSAQQKQQLMALYEDFTPEKAQQVKDIEATTNHDVKAVEYYIKNHMKKIDGLSPYLEFVHFACTSEDINNLAYGLILKQAKESVFIHEITNLTAHLRAMAHQFAGDAMMAKTHGQPATPTTMGKELANVVFRLERQLDHLKSVTIYGKMNGAVGNYNAHICAYPEVDWPSLTESFIADLGLLVHPYTTQIEPHDYIAETNHVMIRINTILLDLCRDIWGYISNNYFGQKTKAGEVGSSTMPHKVNPIDFENAEGNLGVANALLAHLAEKLPVSRWQRDLTDSTVLRAMGTAFGHALIAYQSLAKGLSKLTLNTTVLAADLNANWALLAEPIQTVMRRYGIDNPYEKLKELTRGQTIDEQAIKAFVKNLDLPDEAKQQLLALTPATYLGNAKHQAKHI